MIAIHSGFFYISCLSFLITFLRHPINNGVLLGSVPCPSSGFLDFSFMTPSGMSDESRFPKSGDGWKSEARVYVIIFKLLIY